MTTDWTPGEAEELAGREGIAMAAKHWCAITSTREFIARNQRIPSLNEVSAMCGVTPAELKLLFPGEVEEVLARLAGAVDFKRKGL